MKVLYGQTATPTALHLQHGTAPAVRMYTNARSLEVAIDLAGRALLAAPDEATQRICLIALTDLVKQRSPETVKEMEVRKRLV